jgi:hypothetical protein
MFSNIINKLKNKITELKRKSLFFNELKKAFEINNKIMSNPIIPPFKV